MNSGNILLRHCIGFKISLNKKITVQLNINHYNMKNLIKLAIIPKTNTDGKLTLFQNTHDKKKRHDL